MTDRDHTGPGHGDVTLSLTTVSPDGGHVIRSWVICECSVLLAKLGPLLGEPQWESVADADAVRGIAEAVLRQPGSVQR